MQRLVECVPNFSEGRRPEVLEAIADALRAHAHVQLLDIESDEDHNRSVFTLVAPPEAMVPAVFDAIKTAAAHIDLEQHRGPARASARPMSCHSCRFAMWRWPNAWCWRRSSAAGSVRS